MWTVKETYSGDGGRCQSEVAAPADTRADRSEMLAALVGCLAILAEIKDPIGAAYRLDLMSRIKSMVAREHRALGVL
jgi:hypothetical protein